MDTDQIFERKDIAKEGLSFFLGLLSTAVGFFFALYFNNKIENGNELKTFENIKKSIIAEITQNKHTIDSSFYKYIDGVIFNDLDTNTSKQHLTNNIFLKYANPELLVAVQNYIRICDLGNKQKNQLKDFRLSGRDDYWPNALQTSLNNTLIEIEKATKLLQTKLNSP